MLVLNRQFGEITKIGDIFVKVVKSKNGGIKLCIDAPSQVKIDRLDILNKVREESKNETRKVQAISER